MENIPNFDFWIPLKPVLGGVDTVARFIIINEESESNQDCTFLTSIAFFTSRRLSHQNLLLINVECNFVLYFPIADTDFSNDWIEIDRSKWPTVHFIYVCQRLFGDNFFITCYFSSWNFHDVRQRFLYNQEQNFSLIRQKTKNFPIDPYYKNRPLL